MVDYIQSIESQNKKIRNEKFVLGNKFVMKPEPKPLKLLESVEREIKLSY